MSQKKKSQKRQRDRQRPHVSTVNRAATSADAANSADNNSSVDLQDVNAKAVTPHITTPHPVSRQLSLVWIVPLVAALLGIYLAYGYYRDLGPLVSIRFATADGLIEGKTSIRFRDVNIGQVEAIRLSKDLNSVVVQARMSPDSRRFLNDKARFWVVRPRVETGGISGLGTLLSGAYIQVDSVPGGEFSEDFTGLEEPPLTDEGAPGLRLVLRSSEAGYVSVGSPVYYREVKVGRVEARRFLSNYQGVEFDLFIDAPHHEIVRNTTRFWYLSGFDFSVSSEGFRVNTPSLEALAQGGIAFDVLEEYAFPEPVASGHEFMLFASREEAREAILLEAGVRTQFTVYFNGSVRGLSAGAPVEFRGVQVGTVSEIGLSYDEVLETVRVPVIIELQPERVRGFQDNDIDEGDIIKNAISQGMRAKLELGNLLTGQLYVSLDIYRGKRGPDVLARSESGMPILPSVPSDLDQLTSGVQRVLARVDGLPVQQLFDTSLSVVEQANALLTGLNDAEIAEDIDGAVYAADATFKEYWRLASESRKDLTQLTERLQGLLNVGGESVAGIAPDSPLYYNVLNTLKDIQSAARAVQLVAESVEKKPEEFLFGK